MTCSKRADFLQKQYREQVSLNMLGRENSDPTFIERTITDDETYLTFKQVHSHQNGGQTTSQNRENHIEVAQKARWCSLFSSIFGFWCTTNLFQKDRQSIKNTIGSIT